MSTQDPVVNYCGVLEVNVLRVNVDWFNSNVVVRTFVSVLFGR